MGGGRLWRLVKVMGSDVEAFKVFRVLGIWGSGCLSTVCLACLRPTLLPEEASIFTSRTW